MCRVATPKVVQWEMALLHGVRVNCTARHSTETYYVGTITDARTDALTVPPRAGAREFKPLYQVCAKRAVEFLGGDYHLGRLAIVPVLPTKTEWSAGARFYRCEVMEIMANRKVLQRTTSVKDGLRGKRPLAIGCANRSVDGDGNITSFTWVDCATPHHLEFTGLYTHRDGEVPTEATLRERAAVGCLGVGIRYTGHSPSEVNNDGKYSWVFSHINDVDTTWRVGDRTHHCYLGAYPAKKLTGSIKGKLPSQW